MNEEKPDEQTWCVKSLSFEHNYAIDPSQWTRKSEISKPGVLNPCLLYIIQFQFIVLPVFDL